ncbi:MAG: polysulfide reductase NrfD [Candidatus Bathyarchaeota archaeon]|nr:polysulfide reductase NrfD [Candidatus Bathyarchaeota archaeon]
MTDEIDKIMRPLKHTSKEFWPFLGGLAVISVLGIYAYTQQLIKGLGVTGLNDVTIWGLYITNFIFFIGISHAGIAISAAVRILEAKKYQPIARIAELLTIVSLVMAGLSIVIDLGRPDRSFLLITKFIDRFKYSPLIWDITAVGTYLVLSSTYLYLPMRRDLKVAAERSEGWRKTMFTTLIPFYEEGEEATIDRLSFWLAVTILPVMVMVHTTVAWIFSLLSARPLWFNAFAGPYYIVAAVASGMASVMAMAAVMRKIYHWEDIITPKLFRGLSNFTAITTLVYLYMMMTEQLGALFAGPAGEVFVSEAWLFGDFATLFWSMTTLGLVIPFLYMLIQAFKKDYVNITWTAIMSVILVIAFWFKRYMIIVPTLSIGIQKVGIYSPTWIEIAILLASFAIPLLLYTILTKIVPLIEMEEGHHHV